MKTYVIGLVKGKKGGAGWRWDRYNTKGERIGKWVTQKKETVKVQRKCLSKARVLLRSSGGKKQSLMQ